MPELPEVETVRRQLVPLLTKRSLTTAWSHPSDKFTPAHEAVGATVTGVRRRGKYLLVDLADPGASEPTAELIIHLGMTGRLSVAPERSDDPHLRACWTLDTGDELLFHDTRRFGRLRVVDRDDHSTIPTLAALGPEPDDDAFTAEHLRRAIGASSRRLKTQLLSQRPVAGLGNIYADEALWRAQVNPVVRRLTAAQATRLHGAIREVLAEGIEHGGTTLKDYRAPDGSSGTNQHRLDCYGRAGKPCPRCGDDLVSQVVEQRTTTWCTKCQRR